LGLIIIALVIYSKWGHWKDMLCNVGSETFGVTLICGLICIFGFATLYFWERKKREQLEQDLRELRNKVVHLDRKLRNK
jgi:hypothetical protein